MKHFQKIDKHLKYSELLIVAIVAFFVGFFLRKLGTDGEIIEGAFGLLGIIALFLAVVDFVRYSAKK